MINRLPMRCASHVGAYIPRSGGCDTGPLIVGACAGGGSGAGIRFSKVGICGAGAPKRLLELRPKPPPPDPCAKPERAKLGVDPTTQVSANTAARRRRIAFLSVLPPVMPRNLMIQQEMTSSVLP